VLESSVGAAKEHPVRRARQVVSKHPRASTSLGEPSPKKAKKGSEVETSARMPEVIPPVAEEQEREEEEEEDEAVQLFTPEVCVLGVLRFWRRKSLHR